MLVSSDRGVLFIISNNFSISNFALIHIKEESFCKESKAATNHHHSTVIYMIMYQPAVMQGPGSGIAMKGFEPAGQCSDPRLQEGQ